MLLRPGYLDCGMPIVANRTDVGAGTGENEGGERANFRERPMKMLCFSVVFG